VVSVVIPVYNQQRLLVDALESVAAQSFDAFETIVVDDGSDTDIPSVVEGYGGSVRLVTHDRSRGAGAARNTGIDQANGEYVAFLDADDTWHPEKLRRQYETFQQSSDEVGLVYSGFVQYDTQGQAWEHEPTARGDIYVEELERDRIHPTSTVMVRRECLDDVGGFDPDLPSRQDYDLWIRITESYEVAYVDEILVEKREQPGSISMDFDRRVEGDRAVFEKVKERVALFDLLTRSRILSYHHHVLGRDYDSKGDRRAALHHLGLAIHRYPVRPISWVMFVIALFDIDRNGRFLTAAKQLVR
jgi:glycosyltransferase involved in cell wall biosynthesis